MELASVRGKVLESTDDYLNKFRFLKPMCFTQDPKYELVEMAAGSLDYSIRKKLNIQYLRNMAQLADRVRQVEHLKAEKCITNKYHRKENVAYLETGEYLSDLGDRYVEESEVNVVELKPGPPYICKFFKPSNGKNLVETSKNDKLVIKIYTFDITKCDEIFYLLVTDSQIIVPPNLKPLPLEQRKKRYFCKYHNFLGNKTSQCVFFMDLVQKVLKEGRLQFGEKSKASMQVSVDPFQTEEAHYVESIDILMVEAIDDFNMDVEKA